MLASPLRPALAIALLVGAPTAAWAQSARPEPAKLSPWQSNKHTWFAASASDAGIIYVRPHLTVGYGAPFWQFVGVDAYAIATNSFTGAYAGWRASLPFLDVQMGWRGVYPFDRRFLPRRDSHDAEDLSLDRGGTRSTYDLIELEITALAPLFGGFVFMEVHPLWLDAPKDMQVYEEAIRAVVDPPFAMRTRLGFVVGLGADQAIKAGAMVEQLVLPGRPKDVTRVGPLVLASFSQTFEGLFTITLPVRSPDNLGVYEGSYGFLGVRMRWAERF